MKKLLLLSAAFAALVIFTAPAWAGGMCAMGGSSSCPMMGGGMNCPPFGAGACKVPILLLSLAAGYAVLALASKQNPKTAKTGRVIGWSIIVISVAGLLCAAFSGVCAMKRACKMKKAMAAASCPMSGGEKTACALTGSSHDSEKSDGEPVEVPGKKG